MTVLVRPQPWVSSIASSVAASQIARDAGIDVIRREFGTGVEIRGLDVTADLSALEINLLQALLQENWVLVFREAVPDAAARARLDRLFGPTSGQGSSWRWDANGIAISIRPS